MRQLAILFVFVALALTLGCNRSSPPAGSAAGTVPAALIAEAGGKAGFVEFSSPS